MLQNKKIVIIGGSTGIGLSAAKAFIANGASVVIVGRHQDSIDEAKKILGANAATICADAMDPSTAVNAIDLCVQQFGTFDGLYHVAGGSGRRLGDGPLHEISLEGWNKTLEWNLTSLMLSNQAAVRKFLEMKKAGTILNMGSVLGSVPSAKYFATHAYAAAKSAIIGFSKSIAAYYAANDIRVNVVAPSLFETPMATRAANDEKIQAFIQTKQPLNGGRMGKPDDLDGIALYFMSDHSRFTTGQVVTIDGGWSISDGQY